MEKVDRCVARNQAYPKAEFNLRERHNERKNEHYYNGDVVPERSHLNVHFKTCDGTYEQEFNRMVDEKIIYLRGLRENAKVFDELVYDINTNYFDEHGGYEYAKEFFAEAYKLAVKEAGGEQYVLSAVMHADERNKSLSEEMGRDVFHYHLHVVYIPVVEKEVRYTKRCKDPELRGKVKEVITQVSHSKKWPYVQKLDENGEPVLTKNGKAVLINTYSFLQDNFHDHMKAAGFTDFERGVRGSAAEHLDVLDFKIKQDEAQKSQVQKEKEAEEKALASTSKELATANKELAAVNKKLAVKKQEAVTISEIEGMAKKTLRGNMEISPENWKTLLGLATEGLQSRRIVKQLKDKVASMTKKVDDLTAQLVNFGAGQSITETMEYFQAKQRAPRRMAALIADILRKPPEKQEQAPTKDRKRTVEQTR